MPKLSFDIKPLFTEDELEIKKVLINMGKIISTTPLIENEKCSHR
jgi:hypothetical protein